MFVPLVHVKEDESFENAMRRFKRKCEKSGILSELKKRQHYEKPSTAGGPCEATTAANRPAWGGTANLPFPTFDAPGALPSCYKYRVFETVVPLRNMLWRSE